MGSGVEPLFAWIPMKIVFVACPVPSEIMLLTTVTSVVPDRMMIPPTVPGRVVLVAVLALLRSQIRFLETVVLVAFARPIPTVKAPTVPVFVREIAEIVLPETTGLRPVPTAIPTAPAAPLEIVALALSVVRFVIVFPMMASAAVLPEAPGVQIPLT
jgi:hypothetical protein